ncbi:MAG: ABC transporter substrate-binding protein [Sphaerochaeta sp.]|nr:ABC transporter substrate-binding protein [uncultured Sphaerochaeta sp.]MDD3057293.1 ABC transporter substrate-binding protein [Sphaerochaeta sp.]
MKTTHRSALLVLLIALLIALPAFGAGQVESTKGTYTVGVSKLLAHPALDAAEQGLMDHLATTGLSVSYDLQNANGDISTASSIAQKFKSDKVSVAVGIATPSAQALAQVFPVSSSTSVVFSAVTDPAEAGLVAANIAGVSDMNPVEEQIKLLIDITGAKRIGNIYASGEANAVVLMELAKAACAKYGVEFVSSAISNSSEVKMAAQTIIDRVDAIYIATDNAVISALASVDDVTTKAGKVLFSADPSGVEGLNAMIAWGFDYYSIGIETGKVIERILKGENAGSIGTVHITDPTKFELWFNLDTAAKLGYTIPQSLQDAAAVLIKDGKKISN